MTDQDIMYRQTHIDISSLTDRQLLLREYHFSVVRSQLHGYQRVIKETDDELTRRGILERLC